MVDTLNNVRAFIWKNGTGNDSSLHGDTNGYGSYHSLANLTIQIGNGMQNMLSYNRSLDLSNGIHTTAYSTSDGTYTSSIYCSYPDQVCVYHISAPKPLSNVSIWLDQPVESTSLWNATCGAAFARLTGLTQKGTPLGMKYDTVARSSLPGHCDSSTGALRINHSRSKCLTLVIAAGTNFDAGKGNPANNFSFQGTDPEEHVKILTSAAIKKPESELRKTHVADYSSLSNAFTLELPDTQNSAGTELSTLITAYNANSTHGDPFLENLLFDYGRHLFISSSRENSLPPNLQGIWSNTKSASWGADYHANINLQMNMWGAEATGLGSLVKALFNYMETNWMPRGAETARLLYGADGGWVTHDEMNIFGHTGYAFLVSFPLNVSFSVLLWQIEPINNPSTE